VARIILITGGSRSGKSAFAQRLAETFSSPRVFVATAPVLDDEMRERIRKHQAARAGRGWETIEEQTDLALALCRARQANVVLVDCLTLWVNNLMYQAQQQGGELSEEQLAGCCHAVLAACAGSSSTVFFVSNEVGMGIIPEKAVSRRFRDLAGRCNQLLAAAAETVALMVCGLPLLLKGQSPLPIGERASVSAANAG